MDLATREQLRQWMVNNPDNSPEGVDLDELLVPEQGYMSQLSPGNYQFKALLISFLIRREEDQSITYMVYPLANNRYLKTKSAECAEAFIASYLQIRQEKFAGRIGYLSMGEIHEDIFGPVNQD